MCDLSYLILVPGTAPESGIRLKLAMNNVVAIDLVYCGAFGAANSGTSGNAADYLLPENR